MTKTSGAWDRWRALARQAARVQSNIVLFVLYFLVFLPIALVRAPFADPLGARRHRLSAWRRRPASTPSIESARRQF